ncbi:MAG: hypothetical protein IH946_05945, partial [Bacteroidetes bacterium]|nr:hypothetical protein [Bacteroidota bacterium]
MKFLPLFVFTMISLTINAQNPTNILITDQDAKNVLDYNYNPALYAASIVIE